MALHLNKFEFPSHKYALIEIGQVVLEKKIVKFVAFSLFHFYLPLEKDIIQQT